MHDAYNRLQAEEVVPQDKILQPALGAIVRERDGLRLDCLTLREKLDAMTAEKARWANFGAARNVHAAKLEEALSRLAREAGVPDNGPEEIVDAALEKVRALHDLATWFGDVKLIMKPGVLVNAVKDFIITKNERIESAASVLRGEQK